MDASGIVLLGVGGGGCCVLDCGEFVGLCALVPPLDPVRACVVLGSERRDRGWLWRVGEWLDRERGALAPREGEAHGQWLVEAVHGLYSDAPDCGPGPFDGGVFEKKDSPPDVVRRVRPPCGDEHATHALGRSPGSVELGHGNLYGLFWGRASANFRDGYRAVSAQEVLVVHLI